jgi:dynein heavy chain
MRALKAILNACGNLRRQLDWPEKFIGLRALNDVNIPKFTSNDIPLFLGITSDLFPGVTLPTPDYTKLLTAMEEMCHEQNLVFKKEFIDKCIQLYDTIMVRHGLMVVGKALSGKSKVLQTLARAISHVKDDPRFVNVQSFYVNPKSITQDQLYGKFDLDSGEWSDGVLAIKIRDCAESQTPDRKWIIFDGPVDAVWVENMNTVLDDNKKLCLNSGQIIKLKPTMTIMFEVEDLSQASPATVSRCGMVLMEPRQLGHTPLITSYCNTLDKMLGKIADTVRTYMHYLSDACIAFTNMQGKFPVPTDPNFLAYSMTNMFECYVKDWRSDEVAVKIPKEAEDICMHAVLFAHIWSIGVALDETTRPKFDVFFQDILLNEDVNQKYKLDIPDFEVKKIGVKLGEFKSLFDLYFDREKLSWINWLKTLPPFVVPKEVTYTQMIVPTIDSIRMNKLMTMLILNGKFPLFCGPTGTGKSITVVNELKKSFDNQSWMFMNLSFSAQTSANQTQLIIDGEMEKRRKGVYGPPLGKQGLIFVDDLNMPQKEVYGAQPPIELLRQWMDYGGWYEIDTNEKEFRTITAVKFVTAMGPPGGGRNHISPRYVRHFNVIYIEPYSQESMNYIFNNVMDWFFLQHQNPAYTKAIQGMRDNIVSNTINIYKMI